MFYVLNLRDFILYWNHYDLCFCFLLRVWSPPYSWSN